MTDRQTRLAAPDVLRVAAIFIVGWFHIWQQSWLDPGFQVGEYYVNLQQMVRHGYMMVDLMLLLSGFLLAMPVARRGMRPLSRQETGAFYVRRFWRIAPSYYLCVILTTLLYALPRGLYHSGGFLAKDLLMHFTFTHTLAYDTYLFSPTASTLWTLAVEVQFYVLWPLIGRLFCKRPGWTCLGLAGMGLLFRAWVSGHSDTTFFFNQLPAQLDLYACGMMAAYVYVRLDEAGRPSERVRRWLAPGGMLISLAAMCQIMYVQPVGDYEAVRAGQMFWRLPLGLLGAAFLVCGCLAPAGLERALGNRVTRFLADISYNFYIWHQFLACRLKDWHIPPYHTVGTLPNMAYEQPWQTTYTLTCFIAAAALAAACTYLWERPLRRLVEKLSEKDKTPAAL